MVVFFFSGMRQEGVLQNFVHVTAEHEKTRNYSRLNFPEEEKDRHTWFLHPGFFTLELILP